MTWKIISANLKGLSKIQKNVFFLFEISFPILEILTFFIIRSVMTSLFAAKNGKTVNKQYLEKY